MRLNMNSPVLRLSVDLTPEQIAHLAGTACRMAAGEEAQEEPEETIVVGFMPETDEEEPDAGQVEEPPVEEPPPLEATGHAETEVREELPTREEPKQYSGFLHLRCAQCGSVKSFCTKKPISAYRCGCGGQTELGELREVSFRCECGVYFRYMTNLDDNVITMSCFQCESPVDLEWNRKKRVYEKMR